MIRSSGASALDFAQSLLAARNPGACEAFDLAETQGADPDECAGGRWMAHMLAGNFLGAWQESDAIRRRSAPDPHRMWNGEPLRGRRVIVRCLHGLGDTIQFLRYAPRLNSIVSQLIIEVPPHLLPLAPCFDGVHRVISWGKHAAIPPVAWDAQIEVTELPYFFRTELSDLPIACDYLQLPLSQQARVNCLMGHTVLPRVGIVWAAGEWNPSRSIPFPLVRNLLSEPGCEFWNLQGGHAHDDWALRPSAAHTRDINEIGDGLMNLACVIRKLDLVITVDTLAAHLAGAMGAPAWLLLQYAADWRWMAAGNTSPWYPSLHLFRQSSPGNWTGLIQHVQQELRTWAQRSIGEDKIA